MTKEMYTILCNEGGEIIPSYHFFEKYEDAKEELKAKADVVVFNVEELSYKNAEINKDELFVFVKDWESCYDGNNTCCLVKTSTEDIKNKDIFNSEEFYFVDKVKIVIK